MTEQDSLGPDAGPRVLLVEDTLEEALLIRTLLESETGAKVSLAQDGIRGCQLAENQDWDLVITDLNLPGQDGMEVIEASKLRSPTTPVLAITGYTGPHYIDQALRTGADEVLTKPLDRQELLGKARVLLSDSGTVREDEEEDARRTGKPERKVLAVSALPGDVEVGCGGILLGHVAHGHEVAIVTLTAGAEEGAEEQRTEEARKAADLLGSRLLIGGAFGDSFPGPGEMVSFLEDVVEDLRPDTVYTPSAHDVRESRLNAHRATSIVASGVSNHYSYQAATSTLEFEPTIFIDISEYVELKMEVLRMYRSGPEFRPHLQPDLAQATARYWGRYLGYGEVEPLEVVRSEV